MAENLKFSEILKSKSFYNEVQSQSRFNPPFVSFFVLSREEGGRLPAHVDVQIGDKLKVYYGPMQDSKVTYEAKVLQLRS